MARQFYHTNRFTRGEVEPALFDRADVDFYGAACKRMRNWLPLPAGAAKRRAVLTRGPDVEVGSGETLHDVHVEDFSFQGVDYFFVFTLVEDTSEDFHLRLVVVDENLEEVKDLGDLVEVEEAFNISEKVCFAKVGPSLFITSQAFPPHRVFFDFSTDEFDDEAIIFFEELLGTVTVEQGSASVSGEDTLFEEQLSASDEIVIDGDTYTVQSIASNTSLTLTANYTGLSKETRVRKEKDEPFGEDQHPALCTFYQGRLLLFSTSNRPVTMWASKAQDLFTILPGSDYDDAPIVYDLLADTGDQFLWVAATDRVFLGSRKMEATIFSDQGTNFTPTTFNFAKVSALGGAFSAPFLTESNIVFLSAGRNQLFSVQFDLARQGFITDNLTALSPQILESPVRSMVYRPATGDDFTPRAFVLKADGTLAVCTLFEQEDVIGWSRFEAPLGFSFKALAAASDRVVTAVERNGTVFLSKLNFAVEQGYILDFEQTFDVTDAIVDVADDLLEGLSVFVLDPEKGNLGVYEVEGGEIDLTEYGGELSEQVIVGLGFTDEILLLPAVIQSGTGVILNQKRRVPRVMVSVNDTPQVLVNGLPVVPSRAISEELEARTGVFTQWGLGWHSQDELRVEGATIYPARILSITREVVT